MSRIGKKPILIPQGVTIVKQDGCVNVRGPKGELSLLLPSHLEVIVEENALSVRIKKDSAYEKEKFYIAQWGTTRALLANNVRGVAEGFEKKLEFEGVGYRAEVKGNFLVLAMGFTHLVQLEIPQGLAVSIEKNTIAVRGIDKQLVGQFAAKIRSVRPVEPYKGKGIKYAGEFVRRKAGKKMVATTK